VINYLVQYDFLCFVFRVIHFLRPAERTSSFEFFGDAALFYQPGEGEVNLSLCLLVSIVEMPIKST